MRFSAQSGQARVLFIQQHLPLYRVAFFENLRAYGKAAGVTIDLAYGESDSVVGRRLQNRRISWALPHRVRSFRVAGRELLTYQAVYRLSSKYDVVVVEQANRHLLNLLLLLRRRVRPGSRPLVAFWGHGYDHHDQGSVGSRRLKESFLRCPDWWFAYTSSVERYLVEHGVPSSRITTVVNAIDVAQLQRDIRRLSRARAPRRALFLGGLYASKRLDYLLQAADAAYASEPEFELVISGAGELEAMVRSAASTRPYVQYIGPVSGQRHAEELSHSAVLLMPGSVGLVAVDSLAAGCPIVTIDHTFHSPEFEYLNDATSLIMPEETSARAFGEATVTLMNDSSRLEAMREACAETARGLSVEQMAEMFLRGLCLLLETAAPWPTDLSSESRK